MSDRAERRRAVANLVTQRIVKSVWVDAEVAIRAYAIPEKGKVVVEDPDSGYRVEHEDIRFCCPRHCWHDIERDAVTQILDQFGYMLIKVIKLNDPPSF